MERPNDWYIDWFESKYYHILYRSRNDDEAAMFINVLQEKLQMDKHMNVLDLCCGRGRHSYILNNMGFTNVHGIDLSPSNIKYANSKSKPGMVFKNHDMTGYN